MELNELISEGIALDRAQILRDYQLAWESRHASLLVRREVFAGKAKFGIAGDGKEVAQIALARYFRNGDWRSGYYRDQTMMAAVGQLTWTEFFAQLYAHTDITAEPNTGGRMMNGHYATRLLDEQGHWLNQTHRKNTASDISPTAGQIPRSLGLAYASKLYRENSELSHLTTFSDHGNEICFATIGDASAAQGMFLETMNAAGVLQVPLLMSVWDDGYGISVPVEYQTTKGSISKALAGLQRTDDEPGVEIFTVKGWDYVALLETYQRAAQLCREQHVPCLVHVEELTQPQGHSSSGSHERYKSKERLAWEAEYDCNRQFRLWILANGTATAEELDAIEAEAARTAKVARDAAWKAFNESLRPEYERALGLLQNAERVSETSAAIREVRQKLQQTPNPLRSDAICAIKHAVRLMRSEESAERAALVDWLDRNKTENWARFNSFLYSQSDESPLRVPAVPPTYADDAPLLDGREIINKNFEAILARDPRVFAIGEDVGKIGDVNQGMAGLQAKFGALRVTDTGIRETTIIGQGIGAALRGLRPITEIQYVDYLLYALPTLSDDLACLHYRTAGGQKAPLIIRTRGHRLEGVWHSGSPMGVIIHSLRGIHVGVPRNLTQAAGMYNTLLRGDDPGLIVEPLNGYRLKEKLPDNLGEFCVPLGQPEVLREGTDLTIVTYGSMCRIVLDAAAQLAEVGISCEVIDVQTLIPFDLDHRVLDSIKKTSRVLVADEDMPGGATGFILHKILDEQDAWRWLDSSPRTLSAHPHRPAYTTDGDYFSKPNVEDIFDAAYELLHEANPDQFPYLYPHWSGYRVPSRTFQGFSGA
jgi:pyruvate/2-oxoglutarate/acetoin dehydrogenase E1 component/TPP-dependent pyruvate/acetoin dehydrogenase alpha subunit